MTRLQKLPFDAPSEYAGVKAKATSGFGGINVHTRKLNSPAKAPISEPAPVPMTMAVMITGIMPSVATTGPIAGSEPSGVKHTTASMASIMANWAIRIVFPLMDALIA